MPCSLNHRPASRSASLAVGAVAALSVVALGVVPAEAAAAPRGYGDVDTARRIARKMIEDKRQFRCFSKLVHRESGWSVTASNSATGAYGLVQAMPGSKMASAGRDWRTNPATQITWGLGYMRIRYGGPCGAWSFWRSNGWY